MSDPDSVPRQHAAPLEVLRRREHLWAVAALLGLTAAAWAYTISAIYRPEPMGSMESAGMAGGGAALFLLGWVVMMAAMMIPAALPLILLYKGTSRSWAWMAALLAGYLGVWALVGLPVYSYGLLSGRLSSWGSLLPAVLLILGGLYQFTALKRSCHARCSSPLFFLMQHYKPGPSGALRLGALHGLDCLGCCAGLMVGLVALGMMNLAWMLTAAVIIFVEKTLPGGHRVAKPLGALMVLGGVALLAMALSGAGGAM